MRRPHSRPTTLAASLAVQVALSAHLQRTEPITMVRLTLRNGLPHRGKIVDRDGRSWLVDLDLYDGRFRGSNVRRAK